MEYYYKKHNLHFNKNDVTGIIKYIDMKEAEVAITLIGNPEEFCFYDLPVKKTPDFYRIAKKGDSLYKPAFTDMIFLVKNGQTFKYRFVK